MRVDSQMHVFLSRIEITTRIVHTCRAWRGRSARPLLSCGVGSCAVPVPLHGDEWEHDKPVNRSMPERTTRAVAVAAIVGVAVAVIWGFFPIWSFWCAIGCGFGITEGIVRVANVTRG